LTPPEKNSRLTPPRNKRDFGGRNRKDRHGTVGQSTEKGLTTQRAENAQGKKKDKKNQQRSGHLEKIANSIREKNRAVAQSDVPA